MFALLGMLFIGGSATVYAQGEDSVEVVVEEPTDTISIDNMDPVYYEEETEQPSNSTTYAIIGGILVVGGVAFYFIRKKKKQ